MIRVLVVDDSLTVRKWIVEVLEEHPDFEVVGEAKNGKEAIHLAEAYRPDLITMDMMMPEMTGLAATEYIMAHSPTRILIVSASTNRGELLKTYDALAAGAISVFEKPTGKTEDTKWEKELVAELKMVSRIPVIRHLKGKQLHKPQFDRLSALAKGENYNLIAIGASTGGPQTILKILQALPADFPIPILCVLHISPDFSTSLPDWFSLNTHLQVEFAKGGENLLNCGKTNVFLAPGDHHLCLKGPQLKLTQDPPRNFCRPSVDVLFESIARHPQYLPVGVLLTGMGKDGAAGMKMIRDTGGFTIAQNEESCVVFGMPKEAIALGAAEIVLSAEEIADELLHLANGSVRNV
ncbi:MAG: chemotaxis-specific protein-glutamate methyltransferase CheB [SAR324 cluster bacterium]|nr:chemotaxis-specific protein-glutamate methyltransferase CheB [SAR324 cluster bacterium]